MAANDSLVTAHVIGDVLDPFYTTIDMMVLFDDTPIISGMELCAPAVSNRPSTTGNSKFAMCKALGKRFAECNTRQTAHGIYSVGNVTPLVF